MKALIHFLFKGFLGLLVFGVVANAQGIAESTENTEVKKAESQRIQAVLETTSGKITFSKRKG